MCASGGWGSGKTHVVCLKALFLSDIYPRNRGVIARQVFEELRQTTMATFFKVCPPDAYRYGKRADSEKYLRLNNGSEILWMHLDDPELEKVIRGLEINWFIFDQSEEGREEIFDSMCSRLGRWDKAEVPDALLRSHEEATNGIDWPWRDRQGKPIVPTYAMLTCNPDTELHWIWRRFHPESPDHAARTIPVFSPETGKHTGKLTSYRDLGYRMFSMDSLDNKYLPIQNRQALLSQDDHWVRRFVHAQWGILEGLIHEIAPESLIEGSDELLDWLRRSCTLHRVLDHGDSGPTTCGWYAVSSAGDVIFYREYHMPNKLISYHRSQIVAMSEGERYLTNLADPSIFFKTQQKAGGRWSVADEYGETAGIPKETAIYWQPADNNELGTRNRISEYLRVDPERVHPTLKTAGAPRLFFVKKSRQYPHGCYHVVREIRAQRRIRIGTEAGRPVFSDERDPSIPDDAYDFCRYAIASRPPIARIPARRLSKWTWHAVHKATLRASRGDWPRIWKSREA